jgi:hypothetical protein
VNTSSAFRDLPRRSQTILSATVLKTQKALTVRVSCGQAVRGQKASFFRRPSRAYRFAAALSRAFFDVTGERTIKANAARAAQCPMTYRFQITGLSGSQYHAPSFSAKRAISSCRLSYSSLSIIAGRTPNER